MEKIDSVYLVLVVLLLNPCACAQALDNGSPDQQARVNIEEMPEQPVTVPPQVLQVLSRDERVMSCLAEGEGPDKIEAAWFVATPMPLRSDSAQDLLVMPANPCLLGANIGPFWIFVSTPKGQKLVLRVDAHSLVLLDSSTKGYRDIRAEAATSSEVTRTVFRFDGKQYRVSRSSKKPI
jgi:hypothetical protein